MPAMPPSQTQLMKQQPFRTALHLAPQCRLDMTQTLMAICRAARNFPTGTARQRPIAEAVMMDRVRELLDRHDDAVFTGQWLASHANDDTLEAGLPQRVADHPTRAGITSTLPEAAPQ